MSRVKAKAKAKAKAQAVKIKFKVELDCILKLKMSTYIKYVFKYLFQADQLSAAELEPQSSSGSVSGSVMPNISSPLSVASSMGSLAGARQRMKCLEVGRLLARETTGKLGTVPNVTTESSLSGASVSRAVSVSTPVSVSVTVSVSVSSSSAAAAGVAGSGENAAAATASATTSATATNQPAQHMRSFADFEAAIKQASGNRTEIDLNLALLPSSVGEEEGVGVGVGVGGNGRSVEGSNQYKTLDLLDCFNQLQLQDYYSGYDIFVGLRIASTLTILFVVFILFVIYKTGCRDNTRSRSQLALSTSYKGKERNGSKAVGVVPGRQAHIRRLEEGFDESHVTRWWLSRRPEGGSSETSCKQQTAASAAARRNGKEEEGRIGDVEVGGNTGGCEGYRDWPD